MAITVGFNTRQIIEALNIPPSLSNKKGEVKRMAHQLAKAISITASVLDRMEEGTGKKLDQCASQATMVTDILIKDPKLTQTGTMLQAEFSGIKKYTEKLGEDLNKIRFSAEEIRSQLTKIAEEILKKIGNGEIKQEQIQGQGSVIQLADALQAIEKKAKEIKTSQAHILNEQKLLLPKAQAMLEKCGQTLQTAPAAKKQYDELQQQRPQQS